MSDKNKAPLSEYSLAPDTGLVILDPLIHLSPNNAVRWVLLALLYN